MSNWLRAHKFKAHLAAFLVMLGTSFSMFFLVNAGAGDIVLWCAIGLFGAATILTVLVP